MNDRRTCFLLLTIAAAAMAVSDRSSLAATLNQQDLASGHPGPGLTETPLQFLAHDHFHYAYLGTNGAFHLHGAAGEALFAWPVPNPIKAYSLHMHLVRKSSQARVYKFAGMRAWVRLETEPATSGRYKVQISTGLNWADYDLARVLPIEHGHTSPHCHHDSHCLWCPACCGGSCTAAP